MTGLDADQAAVPVRIVQDGRFVGLAVGELEPVWFSYPRADLVARLLTWATTAASYAPANKH